MPPSPAVTYRVRVLPEAHALEVELTLSGLVPGPVELAVPTWVPGAYGFMKYARDLVDVRAFDPATDQPLAVERHGWSGFTVDAASDRLVVRWRAGAFDPAWGELAGLVDHEYAVLLGTRYLHRAAAPGPVQVDYLVPDGWALHHPAGAKALGARSFEYPSFAALLDTPVVLGRFALDTRVVAGTPFHAVFLDDTVGLDREKNRLLDAIEKIALACRDVFGSFPFEAYTFVFTFDPAAHWGLEHANATMIALDALVFLEEKAWGDAVRVVAHELFHAWNVCRLKPHPLGAPDLVHGSFPDALWVAEGFTRWYEFLLGARTGLVTPRRALANVVNYYRHLCALPAYGRVSAADSSRATFLNHNRFPGSTNASIDYYDKGMLIAFDLDAALRLATPPSTLDAELRGFYDAFAGRGSGFTSADAVRFFGAKSAEIQALLAREVDSPGGLATPLLLEALGFELATSDVPYVGLVLKDDQGPVVADVLDGSPASRTGLASGDELVRVNGHPFHARTLRYLATHEARLSLEVRRGQRPLRFELATGTRRDVTGVRWTGSASQLERLRAWFGPSLSLAADEALDLGPYDNFHGIQNVL